jgi:hypothetical protein
MAEGNSGISARTASRSNDNKNCDFKIRITNKNVTDTSYFKKS